MVAQTGWIRHWCHSRNWPGSRRHCRRLLRSHRRRRRRRRHHSFRFLFLGPATRAYRFRQPGRHQTATGWCARRCCCSLCSSSGPTTSLLWRCDVAAVGRYHCGRCTSSRSGLLLLLLLHFRFRRSRCCCCSGLGPFSVWAFAPSPPHPDQLRNSFRYGRADTKILYTFPYLSDSGEGRLLQRRRDLRQMAPFRRSGRSGRGRTGRHPRNASAAVHSGGAIRQPISKTTISIIWYRRMDCSTHRSSEGDKLRRPGSDTRRGLLALSWKMLGVQQKKSKDRATTTTTTREIEEEEEYKRAEPAPLTRSPFQSIPVGNFWWSGWMRSRARPVENGPSTPWKIFVVGGHDGARSSSTPTLLGVVAVQWRTRQKNPVD